MFVLKKKSLKFAEKPFPATEIFCSILLNLFPISCELAAFDVLSLTCLYFIPVKFQFHWYLLVWFPAPRVVKLIANMSG